MFGALTKCNYNKFISELTNSGTSMLGQRFDLVCDRKHGFGIGIRIIHWTSGMARNFTLQSLEKSLQNRTPAM